MPPAPADPGRVRPDAQRAEQPRRAAGGRRAAPATARDSRRAPAERVTEDAAGGNQPPPVPSSPARRFAYERCLTGRCDCHVDNNPKQPARGVALTLATYADADGAIPAKFSPSLKNLARASGFGRSTVAAALAKLEAEGWIERTPPPVALARSQRLTTAYRLVTPSSPGRGLVQDVDPGSPAAGLALVQDVDPGSPAAGHKPVLPEQPSPSIARASEDEARTEPAAMDGHAIATQAVAAARRNAKTRRTA
jgi:hypothetical protein